MDARISKTLRWYLPALALLAWFLPSLLHMGFSWDDREALFENPAIRNFDLARILSEDYWEARGGAGVFRPLLSFSLALDLALFGDGPVALHRSTLLLHGLCALALALALGETRRGLFWPALALLFLHPVSAEQAVWITGRSGSLALGLGGLGLFAARRGRLVAAALCCWLAAHAREDGLLFVPVIAMLLRREARRRWWIAGLVVLLSWTAARWLALGSLLPRAAQGQSFGLARLAAPAESFGSLARLLLLVEAPRVLSDGTRPAGIFLGALPAFLLATAYCCYRRHAAAKGLGWTLIAFLPFAQLVPFGETVAGRFAYPLLPGIVLAAGAAGRRRARFVARSGLGVVILLGILLGLGLSWLRQVFVLSDARRAFAQVLELEPDNRRAQLLRALAEENAGDQGAALARLRALARRHPGYAKAQVNLGRLLLSAGEVDAAEGVLRRAVLRFPRSSRAALTLARVLFARRRWADAAFACEEALERNPREAQAARYLCRCFLALGEIEDARAALARARAIDPGHRSLVELERACNR